MGLFPSKPTDKGPDTSKKRKRDLGPWELPPAKKKAIRDIGILRPMHRPYRERWDKRFQDRCRVYSITYHPDARTTIKDSSTHVFGNRAGLPCASCDRHWFLAGGDWRLWYEIDKVKLSRQKEEILGYNFKNQDLLWEAIIPEADAWRMPFLLARQGNRRIAMVGDVVLNMILIGDSHEEELSTGL